MGGGGGGLAGTPSSQGPPLWSPPKAGQKILTLNPLGTEGAEAELLAVSLKRWKGRREGGAPPPPSSYGVRPFKYITGCPHPRERTAGTHSIP